MVEGISSGQMGRSALASISSSNASSDTSSIKNEIKSSGQSYSAQQIASKYDISLSEAQQILSEIESENSSSQNTNASQTQNPKTDIPDSPQLEESEPPATITYRV